jgi:CRISPR-associated endoribonuclease Cas6
MRLRVTLDSVGENILDLNYSYHLASLIYRSIERVDQSLSLFLHKPGVFKFFTFSKLMPSKGRFRIEEGRMIIDNGAHFFFSTMKNEIAAKLVEGLLTKPEVKIGDAEFVVSEIKVLKEKDIGEREKFVTLSPINVTTAEDSGNGRLRIVDLYPNNPRFYDNLRRNLVKKYAAFYGKQPDKVDLELKVLRAKTKRIRIKNTFHRCVEMVFEAEGSKELLEMGYKAGFGERNSMGFGMVKVV